MPKHRARWLTLLIPVAAIPLLGCSESIAPELRESGPLPCQLELTLVQWIEDVPDSTLVCLVP